MNYITRIQNAINYIEENLTEEISTEQLSRVACFSTSHFKKLFKVSAGLAVKEYLRKRRLSAALMDLKLTDKKIIKIAFDYQYETPEAFTRAFFARYGINPADYRNGNKVLNTFPKIELNSHIIPDKSKTKKDSKMNNEIKIVPYSHDFAEAVAEMWREMSASCGAYGSYRNKTAEQVIEEENSSYYLELYLAVKNEKVSGYAKLMVNNDYQDVLVIQDFWAEDNDSAALLYEKSLQKTTELGYGVVSLRPFSLDMCNLQQIKTYGFFSKHYSEKIDYPNLIPLLNKMELTKEIMSKFDLIQDDICQRKDIFDLMENRVVNSYGYKWRKADNYLAVQADPLSEIGIQRIETADFSAEINLNNAEFISGLTAEAQVVIRNISGKPLQAIIKGLKNNLIDFTVQQTAEVSTELVVPVICSVNKSAAGYSELVVNLNINCRSAVLTAGFIIQQPLTVKVRQEKSLFCAGETGTLEMIITNNQKQPVKVEFQLPKVEGLIFDQYEYQLDLAAGQTQVRSLDFTIKSAVLWNAKIKLKIDSADQKKISQDKIFDMPFATLDGIVHGGGEVFNGSYQLALSYHGLSGWRDDFSRFWSVGQEGTVWFGQGRVKIGSQVYLFGCKQKETAYEKIDNAVLISRTFPVIDYNRLQVTERIRLGNNGIIQRWYELQNLAAKAITEPIAVYNPFFLMTSYLVIPYRNRFVQLADDLMNEISFWNSKEVIEPWLFAEQTGVCWPKNGKLIFLNDYPFYEIEQFGGDGLNGNATLIFAPVTGVHGTFDNWHQFREYAMQAKMPNEKLTDSLDLTINNGNPVCQSELVFKVEEYKNLPNDNSLNATINGQLLDGLELTKEDANCREFKASGLPTTQDLLLVEATVANPVLEKQYQKILLPKDNKEIVNQIVTEKGKKVYCVDNGLIKIKASPDFAPVLHSCTFQGYECLDSSFNSTGEIDWLNDYIGGIDFCADRFGGGGLKSRFCYERFTVDFVQLSDNFQNSWSGLKITVYVEKIAELQGLTVECYALLLPGSPVVYNFNTIRGNERILHQGYASATHLNLELGKGDNNFIFKDKYGHRNKLRCGDGWFEVYNDIGIPAYQSANLPFKIYGFNRNIQSMHNDVMFCSAVSQNVKDGDSILPQILIFTDKDLETEWLKDLDNIRFEL